MLKEGRPLMEWSKNRRSGAGDKRGAVYRGGERVVNMFRGVRDDQVVGPDEQEVRSRRMK